MIEQDLTEDERELLRLVVQYCSVVSTYWATSDDGPDARSHARDAIIAHHRRAKAEAARRMVGATPNLSRDVADIAARSLG